VIVLTILLLLAFSIVLAIVLSPFEEWLQSFLSNVISGTLTAPFIAVTWTILYYRLHRAKEVPEPAPAAPPA
jgi:predicted PurR-regulated permease PerM